MLKTVLITGASSGIGLELARVCAEKGHDLVLVARSHERLKVIAEGFRETYNIQTNYYEIDLSQPGASKYLVEKLEKDGIRVDALINNAGFGLGGKFSEQEIDRVEDMMQVNMVALTELTRLLIPKMLKRFRGCVMNVASTAAFLPGPYMSVYYATKAYVLSFSEAIAEELSGSGVTVTALCPGPTKSRFADEAKVSDTVLFKGELMDARSVALAGYQGMINGKRVVIPGVRNQAVALAPRFLPAEFIRRIVGKANRD